jgi:formate dehydrogenase subunit beta
MIDTVREHVKKLLDSQEITGFLGLKEEDGNIFPHLFETSSDVEKGFTVGDSDGPEPKRYPIASTLMTLASAYPDAVLGVLVRGCDERALNELVRWNQIPRLTERIVKVGIACPKELAEAHECLKPFPDEFVAGEKADPASYGRVQEIANLDIPARLEYWLGEFDRCIKCYGCRDVCPVCFCNVCTLEEDVLIRTGDLPPENPMFHLTRAIHMAGRCIDCNLCTEVCPAEIPLRTLYKRVAEIVRDEFDYVAGQPEGGKSPLNVLGPDPGHTSAND